MPLVSAVIPTFGRAALVRRAVVSALAQTHSEIEVVVVVDGDDPETVATLAAVADPRLRVLVNAAKLGARATRDAGVDAARGDWIAFLDDDDEWLPAKIERQLAIAPADGRAVLATMYRVVSPLGTLIRPARPHDGRQPIDEWLFGRATWTKGGEAMLQCSALMFPRAMFARLRFADTGQHEDWELAIRAVKSLGYRFLMVPEALTVYHLSTAASLSKTFAWRGSLEWIDRLRDVVSPRAYAGFCLTVVTQGLPATGRTRARATLLRAALRHGQADAKQLFAFALIGAVPHEWRKAVRAVAGRRRTAAS